jgi:hypothetical protein
MRQGANLLALPYSFTSASLAKFFDLPRFSHANPKTVARALSREPNLARAKIGSPNSGSGCGSSSPRLESFFSEDAERAAGCEMALDVESVLDDGVNGQEALS